MRVEIKLLEPLRVSGRARVLRVCKFGLLQVGLYDFNRDNELHMLHLRVH
jgi:hypothetical protein